VNPLLPAAALTLCLLGVIRGVVLLRSTPEGAERLFTTEEESGGRRRSLLGRLQAALGRRFGRRALALMSQRRIALIRHRLDAAGRPGGMTVEGYAGAKAASAIIGAGAGGLVALLSANPLPIPLCAALGWLQVDFAISARARARQAQIDRDLPDFLDVLTITVGAGLGFRAALGRVSDAMGGPLGEEVRTALRQMGFGAARRSAFEELRERNDSEALIQFVTALLQAEELGAPLGETLGSIAEDMRKAFQQRARRQAARATPRVSLVITTVIVPAIMIVMIAALYISIAPDLQGISG